MRKIIIIFIILLIAKISFAQGLPYGTPRVLYLHPIPCLNGGVMIWIQPPSPTIPPGPYFVPVGTNRYSNFIYPPIPGTKMLGWWIPGGVCIQPGFPTPYPIFTVGTITGYGSALGF
ncbi:MAG: hypothetical protein ACP5JU_01830 [Minisyncoccia bacterium]